MNRTRLLLPLALVLLASVPIPMALGQSKGRILVTAFEPFPRWDGRQWTPTTVNASWEAVKALDGRLVDGYQVTVVRLPVDYRRVASMLPDLIAHERPAAYVAFGEGYPGQFNVETTAYNHVNPEMYDVSGFLFRDPTIRP